MILYHYISIFFPEFLFCQEKKHFFINLQKEGFMINKKDIVFSEVMSCIDMHIFSDADVIQIMKKLEMNYGNSIRKTPAYRKSPLYSDTIILTRFLDLFWDYDTSDYIQNKLSHGQKLCRRYCHGQQLAIKKWKEFFTDETTISSLTADDMVDFEQYLKQREINGQHLCNETINNIINAGNIALKWAVRKNIIHYNPVESLTHYAVHSKERGILTKKEVLKLFTKKQWKDNRVRTACLISMTTGMRSGEILALRESDIDEDFIHVNHTWHYTYGMKCPKNGYTRKVPLYPEIRNDLLKLINENPYKEINKGKDSFIFWSKNPMKPLSANVLTKQFNKMLQEIGISEEERKKRNIVFHSWRHFHATELAGKCSEHSAQVVLGHLSPMMTRHYANHRTEKDIENVRKAMVHLVHSVCKTIQKEIKT